MLKMIVTTVLAITMFITFNNSFASEEQEESLSKAQELFEKKCSKCHSIERALTKTKDIHAWKRTTKRMSGYSGGAISKKDAEVIAGYLAYGLKAEAPVVSKPESELKIKKDFNK